MSLLERLARLVGADTSALTTATALASAYRLCVMRAERLQMDSEEAPQESSRVVLRDLAVAEQAQAERLLAALTAAGVPRPDIEPLESQTGTLNHWGRLVGALEAHRQSVQLYREYAVRLADSAPTVGVLMRELCDEETHHCERLRDLIARADPQALN